MTIDMEATPPRAAPVAREFRRRFDPALPLEARCITGEELAAACRAASLVELQHAVIRGPFTLREERIVASLRLSDCVVADPIDLTYAHLEAPFRLERCEVLNGARFDGAVFGSDLYLLGTRFTRPSKRNASDAAGEVTTTLVSFDDTRFYGLVAADGVETGDEVSLSFVRARFAREVFLRGAIVRGGMNLTHAEADGSLYLDGATILRRLAVEAANVAGSLIMRSCRLGAGLDAAELRVDGSVDLGHAEVEEGTLYLAKSRVGNDLLADGLAGNRPIDVGDATVGGNVSMVGGRFDRVHGEGIRVQGRVALKGIRVSREVDLAGARTGPVVFVDADCDELRLDGAHVAGGFDGGRSRFHAKEQGVDFRALRVDEAMSLDGIEAAGAVQASGMVVGTDLSLTGARFSEALDLHRASIAGDFTGRGMRVEGAARLTQASIEGQTLLSGASFGERVTFARGELGTLVLSGEQGADEKGSVVPWPPPRFEHGLDLRDVHVRGAVLLIGVKAGSRDLKREHDAFSVDLAGARIDGELVLRHVSATDPIRLERAKIAGPVRTEGNVGVVRAGSAEYASGFEVRASGRSSAKGTIDLDLAHARVEGAVDLSGLVDRERVTVSLRGTTARRLVFPEQSRASGSVDLIGFESPAPPDNWGWLIASDLTLVGGDRAYLTIADQLRRDAKPSAARRLERAARRALRRRLWEHREMGAYLRSALRWMLFGDGAVPWVVVALTALAVGGAALAFRWPGAVLYEGTTEIAELSTLGAIGVAVDRLLPFDTPLADGLTLAREAGPGMPWAPAWVGFLLQVLGWVLLGAALARLLRRT